MKIKVKYLARLREALQTSDELLTDLDDPLTVNDIVALLRARGGAWSLELDDTRAVRVAVNYEMCDRTKTLSDKDELAFFPPVTGG
ncbi:MAG: MoaD/ThiS family protein [Burkholderiales bacterium]|jgi:molybdopterin synthase sulfur carrier subunit|nr:MoaD/ThiS family protein [Burkholderiales bacterium]